MHMYKIQQQQQFKQFVISNKKKMNPNRRNEKQTVIDIFNRRATDIIQRKQTQKQLLAIIEQKNTQLSVLNHVNTRLGAQLAILQKKLGIDHDVILKQIQNTKQISAAFHFETQQLEYLDALLTAYDENNLKQKKIIAHLYSSLEDAQKKAQNLVKDNQFLLSQLQQKSKQILQIYSKGFADDNLTSAYSKLQRQTQIQQIQNIRQQNQYILKNFRQIQQKLQQKQQQLKETKNKSNYYFQMYKKQSQDLKLSLIKIDDLMKIKDVLQKKFDQITAENIQLQTLKEQLQTKINRIQNQCKQLRNQYNMHRTVKHQQIERVSQQFSSLKLQHDASQKRQRQYFNKNMILQKDLQNQKEQLKQLRRQLQKTKSDFKQMVQMCQAYETKINIYSKKQTIVKQTMSDCKQKLQQALLQRDKAILKQKQLQKVIQSIKQRNKNQMQVLKNTFEKLIFQQNQKIKVLQEDKEDTNSVFYQNQCSLKHQIDKLKREVQSLKQQNNRHVQSVKLNSGSQIVGKLKELEEKNQALNRILNQKERTYRQDIDHKDELIRDLENQNRQMGRQVDRQRAAARQAVNQRTQYKSKISILQKQKQCLEQELAKLKRSVDQKANILSQQSQARMRQLEQKLSQSIQRQKITKQNTIDLLQKHDEAQEQYQLQCQNKIITLQTELKRLRRKLQKQKK